MNFESRAHDLYQRITKDGKLGWTAYNFAARIVEEQLADLGKIKSCELSGQNSSNSSIWALSSSHLLKLMDGTQNDSFEKLVLHKLLY
jgi:hypothetical protein